MAQPIPPHDHDVLSDFAGTLALYLSSKAHREFTSRLPYYRPRVILRPQEISNHPEIIRLWGAWR